MTMRYLGTLAVGGALVVLPGCAAMDDMIGGDGQQQAALPTAAPTAIAQLPPPAGFVNVSQIVDLPDFVPGLGRLYARPDNLPEGPYLGYDRAGNLANTTYMIPLDRFAGAQSIENLPATTVPVDHVDLNYNAGHAGLAEPHYHVVMWHIPRQQAELLQ